MTHQLNSKWSLYLHYKDLGKLYNENIEKLIDIDTIETFWGTFNNIPSIYDIFSDGVTTKKIKRNNATPCAYSFFRQDVYPCWEDPKNIDGFELSFKNKRYNIEHFNDIWFNCILNLVGENDEMYDQINGIRVVDCTKKDSVLYRVEIWAQDNELKDEVEKFIRTSFELENYKFLYRNHKNAKETT